jgi:undecaprenyl-diphosphatase
VRLSLQHRRFRLDVADKDERLAWMIIFATIPVGLTGVVLEHTFRVVFAKPLAAAVLLFVNGLILLAAEAMRRSAVRRGQAGSPAPAEYPAAPAYAGAPPRATVPLPSGVAAEPTSHRKPPGGRETADIDAAEQSDIRIARLSYANAILIGATQILALLAGISRSGVTMAGGLWRGLDHEDAARFAFLLATPVILAAGVLKVPSLFGPAGAHIHGQVILGVIVCGIAAYLSVRFLVRWFQTRTLTPFAVYCLAFGALSILRFL